LCQPDADSPSLEQLIEFAKSDLSHRLGVEPVSINLVEARSVTWRSGALGCPQPGMSYTQALVPGYRIMLAVALRTYAYHGNASTGIFLCPSDRTESPADSGRFPE